MWYPDRLPDGFTKWFASYHWHGDRDEKTVYLTFDDGPTPVVTDYVLELLEKYRFKATFFCIGDCVLRHPEIYNQIITAGHAVGNHTMNHFNRWKTKEAIYLDNVKKASQLIDSKLFRPPYGKILPNTARQLRKQGYDIIMWDVISGDFDHQRTAASCLQNLKKNTTNGSIIVLHDSEKAFEKLKVILPDYFEYLRMKGYSCKQLKNTVATA